jgi:hypothetical protein
VPEGKVRARGVSQLFGLIRTKNQALNPPLTWVAIIAIHFIVSARAISIAGINGASILIITEAVKILVRTLASIAVVECALLSVVAIRRHKIALPVKATHIVGA